MLKHTVPYIYIDMPNSNINVITFHVKLIYHGKMNVPDMYSDREKNLNEFKYKEI